MDRINDSFEDLSQCLRVLMEANLRSSSLMAIDRAEAVGNIEASLSSLLNSFHSLYDALNKDGYKNLLDWYKIPELSVILTLRNARHHNQARKVRTMYSYYSQNAAKVGSLEMYILVDFPAEEEGADTFNLYMSWEDYKLVLSMPESESRIKPQTSKAIKKYLNSNCFPEYAKYYELSENRIFFNLIPLVVNALTIILPKIEPLVITRSTEGKAFLDLFKYILPANTFDHEVNCGPIAYPE